MKSLVLSSLLIFVVHTSVSAVAGDVSNESLAEAWGLETALEIAEVENMTHQPHPHHHHHGNAK